MNRWNTAETVTYSLLRLAVGVVFVTHGWMKLADTAATNVAFQSMGIPFPQVSTYLAIAGELFGGLGLLVGLFTKVAALGPFAVMLGAISFVHLGNGLLAKNGGWEYPLTLLLTSLLFVAHGGGRFSIDAALAKYRSRRPNTLTTDQSGQRPGAHQHPA